MLSGLSIIPLNLSGIKLLVNRSQLWVDIPKLSVTRQMVELLNIAIQLGNQELKSKYLDR